MLAVRRRKGRCERRLDLWLYDSGTGFRTDVSSLREKCVSMADLVHGSPEDASVSLYFGAESDGAFSVLCFILHGWVF